MIAGSVLALRRLRKDLLRRRRDLEEIQRRKLLALVRHAYDNVPYYRRLFDSAGILPADIRGVGDLVKIPVTDKSAMRAMDRSEITAGNVGLHRCVEVFTSGSTGMPTHIYLTREDHEILDLVYLRSFLENGLTFFHKRAFILDPHSFDTRPRWYQRIGLARAVNISCFTDPGEQAEILARERPDFIHGYPSSLSQVARAIAESGTNGVRPALVSTAAEVLRAKDRELIAAVFGVAPFDRYAARECGSIAWECERHGGYHINIDSVVVEFVEDGHHVPPGRRGDVVITNLHSYAMPFIRYRIGDIGVPSDKVCPCGRELPLMEIVEGRDEDFIVLPDGRKISPMMVTGTLDHVPGVRQFRVIQEEKDIVRAILAKGKGFNSDTLSRAEKELRTVLGPDVVIRCHAVEDIPREPSGKVRAVISKVS